MREKKSYVKCKKCGFLIELPFECRFQYPLHFAVKCQRCGYINVYHRLEVIQEDDKYCEEANKRAEKFARSLREIYMLLETGAMIQPQFETLLNISQRIKEKLEGGYGGI
jgi:DNA-directed RNA polymerase subunit RPC12/RpoP